MDNFNLQNYVFIDIEATDENDDREMIQFSAIKTDHNGNVLNELNIFVNPKKTLSNHIKNLLNINEEQLSKFPTFDQIYLQIINFIENSIIVCFGDFDYSFLKKKLCQMKYVLNNDSIDFSEYLKQKSKMKNIPSLINIYNLLQKKLESNIVHDALNDSEMLKYIFFNMNHMSDLEINEMCMLAFFIPRWMTPMHESFCQFEKSNSISFCIQNSPNKLLISYINLKSIYLKPFKKHIHYIHVLEFYYNNKKYSFYNPYKNMNSSNEYIYKELYIDELKPILVQLISFMSSSNVYVFISKKELRQLLEIIYNVLKSYCKLQYVNLNNFLTKKNHKNITNEMINDIIKKYNEIIDQHHEYENVLIKYIC